MQRFSSPRRFGVAGVCLAVAILIAGLLGYALATGQAGTLVIAGPVCVTFLVVVAVRAFGAHVAVDASGGRYVGYVRTKTWRWTQVRHVGRQSSYAFGSTGSTPELVFRGGGSLVLVALSDPRHPATEDAFITCSRELMRAGFEALRPQPTDPASGPVDQGEQQA